MAELNDNEEDFNDEEHLIINSIMNIITIGNFMRIKRIKMKMKRLELPNLVSFDFYSVKISDKIDKFSPGRFDKFKMFNLTKILIFYEKVER